jgi:hypothetical protein
MGLQGALYVGSVRVIAVKQNTGDRAEALEVPCYVLGRHALVHRRG